MYLFEQIKILHDNKLFCDLNNLASFAISLTEQTAESSLTTTQKYQSLVYYGNGLYKTGQYCKAKDIYHKALSFKKSAIKTKGKSINTDLTSDVEVRYKLHLCQVHLKMFREAMNVLESIGTRNRTAKINLSLGKLYHRSGMDRSAVTCFKEVVRECPLALDAIKSLLKLGVKGAEISTLHSLPMGAQNEWIRMWIKGNALMYSRDYNSAKATFICLESKMCLRSNVDLLCTIGECCFNNGDYTQSLLNFQRAHSLDPYLLNQMDTYSYLLCKEKKLTELESLYNKLMSVSERAPQPWIAIGYFCMSTLRPMKALYFAQRALSIEPESVFGLLLKGSALLQLKNADAVISFREALKLAPFSFEAHCGLIEAYSSTNQLREAAHIGTKAIRTLGADARTLTLCATVLVKKRYIGRAKQYLEKVIKMHSTLLEPVYLLADIYLQEQEYEKGIILLRAQLQNHSTCRLHQMLADLLARNNEPQEALDQYNIALKIDPSNTLAKEGMEKVEKQSDLDAYRAGDTVEGSENDMDLEGSDNESGLSESEFVRYYSSSSRITH